MIKETFAPHYGSGQTVTPSTSSGSVALGFGDKTIVLTNLSSSVVAYVRTGVSGLAATTADYPVPASAQVSISKPQDDTHIAYITSSGSGSLHIMSGEGF
jgi:hypothetical protein